jgi:hypothetical protein
LRFHLRGALLTPYSQEWRQEKDELDIAQIWLIKKAKLLVLSAMASADRFSRNSVLEYNPIGWLQMLGPINMRLINSCSKNVKTSFATHVHTYSMYIGTSIVPYYHVESYTKILVSTLESTIDHDDQFLVKSISTHIKAPKHASRESSVFSGSPI